jgi:hypothetical protein
METRETDTVKAPVLVFDLFDGGGNRLHWESLKFQCFKSERSGGIHQWSHMKNLGRIRIDHLDADREKILKLYIWNYRGCNFRVFNPDLSLKGYY